MTIFIGYYKNYPIIAMNDMILKNASNLHDSDSIELYKLKDDNYAGAMPYRNGFEHMEYWIRKYYTLPNSIHFTWKSSDDSSVQ